jgi:hypothetical protein
MPDISALIETAKGLGFLLLLDAIFGSLAAWKGGTFKPSWLYLFATTKGLAYAVGMSLLLIGEIAPDLSDFNVSPDWFGLLGLGFLSPLAVSVVASIAGNVNQLRTIGDHTPPTGAPGPDIGIIEDGEVPEEGEETPH